MKNYGIRNFQYANVENFTSDIGIKLRRGINPVVRPILKLAADGNIIIDKNGDDTKFKIYISGFKINE